MNAANEIAVEAFLNKKIGFLQLSDIIEHTIQKVGYIPKPTMDDYFETDKESRIIAKQLINQSI
jgi:1-deoxy-D-xylulose-5-phosphate reductoisomerase